MRIAQQAPTGSNAQGWHFVFVEDADKKTALADLYGRNFDLLYGNAAPTRSTPRRDTRGERQELVRARPCTCGSTFHEVPVMLIPCIWGRLAGAHAGVDHASVWGSLLPAVWSFMLARARGGWARRGRRCTCPEREAADLLGIPYDKVMQAGLIPVAHTIGTDFKPASREPASDIIHWNALVRLRRGPGARRRGRASASAPASARRRLSVRTDATSKSPSSARGRAPDWAAHRARRVLSPRPSGARAARRRVRAEDRRAGRRRPRAT